MQSIRAWLCTEQAQRAHRRMRSILTTYLSFSSAAAVMQNQMRIICFIPGEAREGHLPPMPTTAAHHCP